MLLVSIRPRHLPSLKETENHRMQDQTTYQQYLIPDLLVMAELYTICGRRPSPRYSTSFVLGYCYGQFEEQQRLASKAIGADREIRCLETGCYREWDDLSLNTKGSSADNMQSGSRSARGLYR